MSDASEKTSWLAFLAHPKLGSTRLPVIHKAFGSMKKAHEASAQAIIDSKLPKPLREFILEAQRIDPHQTQKILESINARLITFDDDDYPALLKETADPPAGLFLRGATIPALPLVSVVGSRKMTNYGKQVLEAIIPPLVERGIGIVSGLALGVDGWAHEVTLKHNGYALAVLGSGIDRLYPSSHHRLATDILDKDGTIISEFAPGTPALKQNFPRRNRIIAGIAAATVVVEAASDSGSLITAGLAADEGREVFAVPGSIFAPTSSGTNAILKTGATPLSSVDEILAIFHLQGKERKAFDASECSALERRAWELLGAEPTHIDKLSTVGKMDIATLSAALASLQLKGGAFDCGAGRWSRS